MAMIRHRFDMVSTGLKHAEIGQVKWRLAKFFDLYPGGADPDAIAAYADVLVIHPMFAIERACEQSIAKGTTFRPSGPELAKLAAEIAAPFWRELDKLRAITTATVIPAIKEDRQAVLARMRDKHPGIFPAPKDHAAIQRDAEAEIERKRDEWASPLTLSDGAKKFARLSPEEEPQF